MEKLQPKFIPLHNSVARLDQHLKPIHLDKLDAAYPEGVSMTITTPSITLETEQHGITHAPAESVEIYGTDNLLNLANAIILFCLKNKQMVQLAKSEGKGGSS